MRFLVLGRLEIVSAQGELVAPRGRMQGLLLAVLLFGRNRPVSGHELVEYLWDGRPTASASANLRTHVARARRLLYDLDPGRHDWIQTTADGYLLRVADAEIDAALFARLAAVGRQALRAGQPEIAVQRLTRAQGLWRGPVLAGLDPVPEVLRAEVAWLGELHLSVLEDGIDSRLSAGEHADLTADLQDLTDKYPLRERFWAQRMLALYRSGRQADALAAYREIRGLLADELGVDPGPDLRGVHQQILTAEPASARPVAVVTTRPSGRPAQLPADLISFTGRDRELDLLPAPAPQDVRQAAMVAAIDGMAGVGKTALAVHAAHRLVDQFPDGQLFLDLHGYTEGVEPVAPADALDRMLRALGTPGDRVPPHLDDRAALYAADSPAPAH